MTGPPHDDGKLIHDAAGHARKVMLRTLAEQRLGGRVELPARKGFPKRGRSYFEGSTAAQPTTTRQVCMNDSLESRQRQSFTAQPGQHAPHIVAPGRLTRRKSAIETELGALARERRTPEPDHRLSQRPRRHEDTAVNRHRQHKPPIIVRMLADQIDPPGSKDQMRSLSAAQTAQERHGLGRRRQFAPDWVG